MSLALQVIGGGVLCLVQDSGRATARRYGVSVSGAMDRFALEVANRLLDNPPTAAALEISGGGGEFELLRSLPVALTGADLGATLDGLPLAPWRAALAQRGARLVVSTRKGTWGARAYLALAGGVDVPEVLGSRSTYMPGGFGGLEGRPLRAGDQLATGPWSGRVWTMATRLWPAHARPAYGPSPLLRLLPGPHLECFAADALETLTTTVFRVARDSNRIGYRLEGRQLPTVRNCSLPSLGVIPGVVQVPPDGTPILLLADAQTTGGYPIVGVVIGPDLPLAAQVLPGDSLRFSLTTLEAAYAARRTIEDWRCAMPEEDDFAYPLGLAGAPG